MASSTANWIFLLLFFFAGTAIILGLLASGDILTEDIQVETNPNLNNDNEFPVFVATDYLIPNVPVCTVNGSVKSFDTPKGIITFRNSTTTLSDECYNYCVLQEVFDFPDIEFAIEMDCSGICWNLTTDYGSNELGCVQEGGEQGVIELLWGFATFKLDLGLGSWNWIITILLVYIPLIMLLLLIFYSLRSGN